MAKVKTLLSQTDPPPPYVNQYPLMLKMSLCVEEELVRVSGKSDCCVLSKHVVVSFDVFVGRRVFSNFLIPKTPK